MTKKISSLIVILTLAICGLNANSAFSHLGFPIIKTGMDTYSQGMGYSGLADQYRFNSSLYNPVLSTTGSKVFFSSGIKAGYTTYEDKDGNSFKDEGLNFPYFNIVVPYKNHRFSFNAISNLSGTLTRNSTDSATISFPGEEDEVLSYSKETDIDNFLLQVDLSYANKNPFIDFALGTNIYLGHQKIDIITDFDSDDFVNPKYGFDSRYKGFGGTLGLSKKWEYFATSFVYHSAVKLEGDKITRTIVSSDTDSNEASFELPNKFAFGSTFKLNKYWKINADLHYDMWEETDQMNSRNTLSFNSGFAYDPIRGLGRWYEKIPFRAGFFYHQLPLEPNDKDLNEIGATFGFSLPLKSIYRSLDFAVEVAQRGNADDHLIQDNEVMFSFGVTGFDIFKKRKRRTEHRSIPKSNQKDW